MQCYGYMNDNFPCVRCTQSKFGISLENYTIQKKIIEIIHLHRKLSGNLFNFAEESHMKYGTIVLYFI